MILYRIEHKEQGTGPFNTSGTHKRHIAMSGQGRRPMLMVPCKIKGRWDKEESPDHVPWDNRLYAFTSLSAFFEWWNNREITAMHRADFHLVVYNAEPLYRDGQQCIFDSRKATRIETVCLPCHPPKPRKKRTPALITA